MTKIAILAFNRFWRMPSETNQTDRIWFKESIKKYKEEGFDFYSTAKTFKTLPKYLQKITTVIGRLDPLPDNSVFLGGAKALSELSLEFDSFDVTYLPEDNQIEGGVITCPYLKTHLAKQFSLLDTLNREATRKFLPAIYEFDSIITV